ncbi:MAG: cobalamin-binding protein [bacterium]|nr:cobalamin-binding protein [bacterium]
MSEKIIEELRTAVAEGETDDATGLCRKALDAGVAAREIIKKAIEPAMEEVGELFEEGEAFLPELILAGEAATQSMGLLLERLKSEEGGANAIKGTVVLGVMFGDHHDIGKNLVKALLSANGFNVVDIGINARPKAFIDAAKKEQADIIACSALITTSLPFQKEVVRLLNDMKAREDYYVVVGGGPVTPQWAKDIHADGYGFTAHDCVNLCKKLVEAQEKPSQLDTIIEGALLT